MAAEPLGSTPAGSPSQTTPRASVVIPTPVTSNKDPADAGKASSDLWLAGVTVLLFSVSMYVMCTCIFLCVRACTRVHLWSCNRLYRQQAEVAGTAQVGRVWVSIVTCDCDGCGDLWNCLCLL